MLYIKVTDPIKKYAKKSPDTAPVTPMPICMKTIPDETIITIPARYAGIKNLCLFIAVMNAKDVGENETKNLPINIIRNG